MELFKPGKVYDFMALRTYGIVLSFGLTIISAILLFYPGPNYGTDFRGGTEIEVGFKKDVKAEDVRKAVTKTGQFSEPDVVHVQDAQNPARFLIRVQEVSTVDSGTQETLKKALCLGSEDATACPPEARATEVKFSAGGDKLGVRYDAPPDIEKIRKQAAPELVAAVKSGTISINAAAAVASLPEDEQKAAALAGRDELKLAAKRVREARRKPAEAAEAAAVQQPSDAASAGDELQSLRARVAALEAENAALRREVQALRDGAGDRLASG